MDLSIPSSVIFTFFFFLLMLAKIMHNHNRKRSFPKYPPGPWKLPLIGNLHQLVGSSLPHHSLRNLAKKYGPLMHLQLGELSNIVVSSPEIARQVLKIHDTNFANRPFLLSAKILSYDSTDIGFSPYGEYWRQLRKICSMELLSAKRVQSFRSTREEEVLNFIEAIRASEGSVVDLSERISSVSFSITSRAAFGKRCKDEKAFIPIVKEISKVAAGFSLSDLYPSVKVFQLISGMRNTLEKLHQRIDRILETTIEEHKKKKNGVMISDAEEDLVDVLLRLQNSGDLDHPLTDGNIKAVILDILSAGSDTSSTTIEWAISELLKNPREMEKVQAEVRRVYHDKGNVDETKLHELKFLKAVIKECLRLHPPAPLLVPRESSQSCLIDGYEIPPKTKVIVNAWAIGRDSKYWEDSEKFYPERFLNSSIDYKGLDFEFIPFGAGRRICPGITFGTAVVELTLAQLLFHFDWKFPTDMKPEDLDMTEAYGLDVRRKTNLNLVPIPYPNRFGRMDSGK